MSIQIGLELLNNRYEVIRVAEYMEQFKMYRIDNLITGRNTSLESEEQIQFYLSKQEKYKEGMQKRIEREKLEQLELLEEQKRIDKLNNDYGFTADKTSLQRGKILKSLNMDIMYNDKLTTKKELILSLINENSYTKEYLNTNRYSAKKINLEYKKLADKMEYRFYFDGNIFIELDKTALKFIDYLLDNNKIAEVKEGLK